MSGALVGAPQVWRSRAACRAAEADVFFPDANEGASARSARERAAKTVCAGCSVASECLSYALRTRQTHGVWGGMSPVERQRIGTQRSA